MALDVPRFGHGSRVPGWDEAADLTKPPAGIPDPATTPVPAELRAEIEGLMARYPDRRSAAIPALAAAQRLHGWCSPEAFEQVACVMRLTPAYLAAVATFYDMLDTEPKGSRRVYVCTNISCSLCGGRELLGRLQEELADAEDVQVRGFECLGACDIAPMVSVDGVYVGPVSPDEIGELARQVREGAEPLPDRQLIARAVADPHANTRDFEPADFEPPAKLDRATPASGGAPPEPAAFGPPMTGGEDGPPAAIEQEPWPPEEDDDA